MPWKGDGLPGVAGQGLAFGAWQPGDISSPTGDPQEQEGSKKLCPEAQAVGWRAAGGEAEGSPLA